MDLYEKVKNLQKYDDGSHCRDWKVGDLLTHNLESFEDEGLFAKDIGGILAIEGTLLLLSAIDDDRELHYVKVEATTMDGRTIYCYACNYIRLKGVGDVVE